MGDKKILYIKMVLAQLAGFAASVLLVQKVFLGPTPTVRAEFIHDVEQLPYTTRDYVVAIPAKVSSFIAEKKQERKVASKTPPPWVFDPRPGETYPINQPRPTRPPEESPNYPLPTTVVSEAPRWPNWPRLPGRPTEAPLQPRPTGQLPVEPRPTRPPQPTPRPPEPTSVPANPSTLEQQTVDIINQRRAAAGLLALSVDGHLTDAARGHSQYMSGGRGRCGHVGEGSSSPLDRAKTAGYGGQVIGETVACGYTTAQDAVDGWWSSPGHKAILTTANARQIGLGWANNYQTALVAR